MAMADGCDPPWSCCVCHEPSALSHNAFLSPICHLFAPLVRCSAMLPAARDRREHALDAALEHIGGRDLVDARSSAPAHRETSSPDARVTAIRRLTAVAARYTPVPDALAQDQLAELHTMCEALANRTPGREPDGGPEIGVYTYDGDTPQDARRS